MTSEPCTRMDECTRYPEHDHGGWGSGEHKRQGSSWGSLIRLHDVAPKGLPKPAEWGRNKAPFHWAGSLAVLEG
jgi:hypothetical protein